MIKTVIFDLDGTLLNTLDDLHASVNYALNMHGYPLRTLDEVRRFVGNGIRKLIERALPENSSIDAVETTLSTFKEHYAKHCNDATAPYDGIMDLLKELKSRDIKMGIVTNKAKFAALTLNDIYFGGLIDGIAGATDGNPTKPDPFMVEELLAELGADKDTTLYVGDSQVDVQTAKNTNLKMVTVLWGFRDKDELEKEGATVFINEPMELIKYL